MTLDCDELGARVIRLSLGAGDIRGLTGLVKHILNTSGDRGNLGDERRVRLLAARAGEWRAVRVLGLFRRPVLHIGALTRHKAESTSLTLAAVLGYVLGKSDTRTLLATNLLQLVFHCGTPRGAIDERWFPVRPLRVTLAVSVAETAFRVRL